MISEKIKNAAEKAMPKEKRFIDGIKRFFEKKPRRLIVSGVIAVAFFIRYTARLQTTLMVCR